MKKVYCGNNADFPGLKKKYKRGSPYECFKIGVGRGLFMPYDPVYNSSYTPIDARKVYCGKSAVLPAGYSYMGNAPMCLQKGVGVGKLQKAKAQKKKRSAKKKSPKKKSPAKKKK